MGRIKTTLIKRVTNKLFKNNSDKFKEEFEDNKQLIDRLLEVRSKKLRNIIAGYATRLKRKEKKNS